MRSMMSAGRTSTLPRSGWNLGGGWRLGGGGGGSGCGAQEQTERGEEFLKGDRSEGFEIGRAPLLRFSLLRLGAGRQLLVLTNHHLLMDGWSMPVFFRELFDLYEGGGGSAAMARPRSYGEYL